MKTKHILLIVGLLTLSGILISNYTQHSEKQFSSNEFTPKEFWQKQYQEKKEKRKVGYSKANKPDMYSKYFKDITTRIGENESGYQMNYKTLELQKARGNSSKLKSVKVGLEFIQRGPANVGGRTRAILIDPDDVNKTTWIAGSATGGIWRTTDGAENWTNLSDDLTNLSVNALAMASSNHDIIYAGTGESFPGSAQNLGNGIWKSLDRGLSWSQLSSTSTDKKFGYVNRLFVNPINAEIVIAATEAGIFKTINGGTDWAQVYESVSGVEDLAAYPTARDTIFAGENRKGILRTVDGGDNWEVFSKGLSTGSRYEVAVSPVNRNFVYTSIDISDEVSEVFFSIDNANNWAKFDDAQNFLGGQGGYDNTLEAHPFIDSVVFVAGVDMWKLAFNKTATEKSSAVKAAYTVDTDFLSFVSFGGSHLNGGLSTEEGSNVLSTDWTSVEIRFGAGLTQKAHRFTIPDQKTSGVPAAEYTYVDYVEVPFQVWDITNNKQLMVSFRDQENDGVFNLYTRDGESDAYGDLGREYIFINAIDYSADVANASIAVAGGHLNKALYMIWPELTAGATWDAANLPTSKVVVEYGAVEVYDGEKTSVADAYGNNGGANRYDQGAGFGDTKIPGLHPDHHNITIIPFEDGNFWVVNGNDGGIGVSENNGVTFTQKPNNYITTQFYGVAKNPDANEYIGGMQDNGTWQSAAAEDASSTSNYFFRLGGDGFECLWHRRDSKKLLGSIYYNAIYRSTNGGDTWGGVQGITEDDGPFVTKLSASKWNPDVVFAVAKEGVYKSTDFGANWTLKAIESFWGGVNSQHNVEVSLADANIVWAGAGMVNDGDFKIHVSQDEGETYTAVNEYADKDMRAYISGISTHPTQASTAYLLFSNSNSPKILRTTDLGQNWEDISGFGTGEVSTNGFPDVVTHCMIVMPSDTKTLWAGTEIGIFESTDDGVSWHALESNFPPVSVYDMQIVGKQVVIATHGRGVWSVDIPDIDRIPEISEYKEVQDKIINLNIDVKVDYDKLEIYLNGVVHQTIDTPEKGEQTFPITVDQAGTYKSYVIGYISDEPFKSNEEEVVVEDKIPTVSLLEVIAEYRLNLGVEIPVLFDKFEIYVNDEIFKTVNSPAVGTAYYEIYAKDAGVYSVYIIGYMFDSPFQSNTKEVEMIITDVETINQEVDQMKIYPNPCRDEFNLQLGNLSQNYSLEILDLSGRTVFVKKDRNAGTNTIQFGSLEAGLYIVRVTLDDKVMSSKIQVIK
ncbi:T9SS type A sorting domain-containing protein [Labilibaculum sp. DW002]|uniref:T9SS type A sorting domain-containing protein n=1 Tax=Paralabilibaculum antarcticum TaxID=2912572 RepID=A0ABT5VQI3_9BACT|nr:T9SS type A sorting domain-containing protein [Labilibaculum sp. DW002]MDE5417684.1 T9SS type A sorting domain-containing protein [Labilibaculum sp. DW002]